MAGRVTACARCGAQLLITAALPVVGPGGIELVCRRCPEAEAAPPEPEPRPEPEPEPAPPRAAASLSREARAPRRRTRRRARWVVPAAALAGATAAVASLGFLHASPPLPVRSLRAQAAAIPLRPLADIHVGAPEPERYHALSLALTEDQSELPWVHPIAVERQLPSKADRRFGAARPGDRPAECGGGHCGVDLGGGRGAIVHAALGGRVVRIKHAPLGASGRYVAIEHPEGVRTTYMHLDSVNPQLVVGIEVASGEPIGTLGSSGVHHSPPHLHFTVQRRVDGHWQYVDPEPMLEQATVLDSPAPMPKAPASYAVDLSKALAPPPPPSEPPAPEDHPE